jgi:hypothetical protein
VIGFAVEELSLRESVAKAGEIRDWFARECAGVADAADAPRLLCRALAQLLRFASELRRSVLNAFITRMRPLLRERSAGLESEAFQKLLDSGSICLDATRAWLRDAIEAALNSRQLSPDLLKRPDSSFVRDVVFRAVMALVTDRATSEGPDVPETMALDAGRLMKLNRVFLKDALNAALSGLCAQVAAIDHVTLDGEAKSRIAHVDPFSEEDLIVRAVVNAVAGAYENGHAKHKFTKDKISLLVCDASFRMTAVGASREACADIGRWHCGGGPQQDEGGVGEEPSS